MSALGGKRTLWLNAATPTLFKQHGSETVIFTLVSVFTLAVAEPKIVATLEGPDYARLGIVAEVIERPAGVDDERFAQQLIDGSGLRQWDGKPQNSLPNATHAGTRSVFSGDGRAMFVKFVTGDVTRSGRVCRMTLSRVGWSNTLWDAHRWCASALGLSLAASAPPLIGTQNR
jgi:hypothetical protein